MNSIVEGNERVEVTEASEETAGVPVSGVSEDESVRSRLTLNCMQAAVKLPHNLSNSQLE